MTATQTRTPGAPEKEWPAWTTLREIEFLDGLGAHAPAVTAGRVRLLELYRDAITSRANWGGVDRDEISRHVKALLDDLTRNNGRRRGK